MSNVESIGLITYGDTEQGLNLGQTATLKTAGLTLENDVAVKLFGVKGIWVGESDGSLEFNGSTNIAYSGKSNAFGFRTVAGGKGYKVTEITGEEGATTWSMTLSTVEGLEAEMEICARLESVNFNPLIIDSIDTETRVITVSGDRYMYFHCDSEGNVSVDDQENGAPCNYITVVGQPELGDMDVGYFAIAFGQDNIAQDKDSTVFGRDNKAIQQYAFVTGRENIGGYGSFVAGRGNIALGNCCTAIGRLTEAYGEYSLAGGYQTKAIGNGSVALGNNSEATGKASVAMGINSKATAETAIAIGYGTECSSSWGVAIGHKAKATNKYGYAFGDRVLAEGEKSLATGYGTIASGYAQSVQGQFNEASTSLVHIVGWGTGDSDRKNIHTLDRSGNAFFAGRLSLVDGVGYGTQEQLDAIENPQDGQIFFIIK